MSAAAEAYLAVDLGSGSGRVMAGVWDGETIRLDEVHRFENHTTTLPSGIHWDLPATFEEILRGIALAASRYRDSIRSLAVATWGVDYGLLDKSGKLLNLPWTYRDSRTTGVMERVFAKVSRRKIYDRTGIQFLSFNTLYQLVAEFDADPTLADRAEGILFIPDLLACWLSGEQTTERTIAGTSQLLKAGSAEWDLELAAALGIPERIFQRPIEPATTIGEMLPELRAKTGIARLPIIACAAHDTASAVIGVPSSESDPLFLSSGTWSLIGREVDTPIVNDRSYAESFSNEHGIAGTTRFLKNVSGMWLLQECLRRWRQDDASISLPALLEEAAALRTDSRIDPNDDAFLNPPDMPEAIRAHLEARSRQAPASRAETVAIILRSLAESYGAMTSRLRELTGSLPDTLHIVGGGSQNALLNRMTADATGLRIVAGPTEATALGNVLVQMLAAGRIASIREGRGILARSFELETFEPSASACSIAP